MLCITEKGHIKFIVFMLVNKVKKKNKTERQYRKNWTLKEKPNTTKLKMLQVWFNWACYVNHRKKFPWPKRWYYLLTCLWSSWFWHTLSLLIHYKLYFSQLQIVLSGVFKWNIHVFRFRFVNVVWGLHSLNSALPWWSDLVCFLNHFIIKIIQNWNTM